LRFHNCLVQALLPSHRKETSMPAYIESALNYAEQNWPVFPCNPLDKRPLTPNGFKDATIEEKQIKAWWQRWPNAMIGVPMGSESGVFCVDLDIKENVSGIDQWNMLLASNQCEEPVTRIHETPSGGKHYIFIWQDDIRSIPLGKLAPGIEIKGDGGYIVVPPSENYVGKLYVSNGLEYSAAPDWLLEMIRAYRRGRDPNTETETDGVDPAFLDELLGDLGKGVQPESGNDFGEGPDIEAIKAALDAIPSDDYEDWYKLGAAIYKTLGDKGYSLFQDWSAKSKKFNQRDCARKWKQIQNVRSITDRSIFWFADAANPGWRDQYQQKQEQKHQQTQENIKPKQQAKSGLYLEIFPIIEQELELRPWLVPGLLLRGHVTATAAPGGTGKSLFTLCIAMMLRTGQPWANWYPRGQFRTLIINSEEDLEELRRRSFAAAVKSMGITDNSIFAGWIHAGNLKTMVIAKRDPRSRMMYRLPLQQQLIDLIRANKYDAVIVDPFAETFEGDETNTELKYVGACWREIARLTGCAIWLIHHTKKYAQDLQGELDALRGGGALGNIARVVTTMFTMNKEEAATFGIPEKERIEYTRFDDAKGNYNLPMAIASWFKKETVHLQNSRGNIPGDNVGAFVPWTPPINNITPEDIARVFMLIDRGIWVDGQWTGDYFTLARTQKENDRMNRWVGTLVQNEFKCTADQAKEFVKNWQEANLLVGFRYKNRDSKMVTGCGTRRKANEVENPKAETLV
jgi:Bifunctional DNA primase/polymerase, N-terminal/AAA domain/Primase C terminal 2 (PriCT-2)